MTHESLDVLISNRSIRSDKAKRELGYRPRPLAATIRDAYRWFAEQGQLDRRVAARVLARRDPGTAHV